MIKTFCLTLDELSGSTPRRVYVSVPKSAARHRQNRYPVMYMFDGQNVFFDSDATYGKSWGMDAFLKANPKELIIVAVECNRVGNHRLEEYSPVSFRDSELGMISGKGAIMMHWMVNTLKPYIDAHYPTLPDRCNTILAGSSMGGLMAMYGVMCYNHVFQRAACLSPSLWVAPRKLDSLFSLCSVEPDTTVYMDYGELEMSNHPGNARFLLGAAKDLMLKGVNLTLRIAPGGSHCEASWEKQIPIFMECLGL